MISEIERAEDSDEKKKKKRKKSNKKKTTFDEMAVEKVNNNYENPDDVPLVSRPCCRHLFYFVRLLGSIIMTFCVLLDFVYFFK